MGGKIDFYKLQFKKIQRFMLSKLKLRKPKWDKKRKHLESNESVATSYRILHKNLNGKNIDSEQSVGWGGGGGERSLEKIRFTSWSNPMN